MYDNLQRMSAKRLASFLGDLINKHNSVLLSDYELQHLLRTVTALHELDDVRLAADALMNAVARDMGVRRQLACESRLNLALSRVNPRMCACGSEFWPGVDDASDDECGNCRAGKTCVRRYVHDCQCNSCRKEAPQNTRGWSP